MNFGLLYPNRKLRFPEPITNKPSKNLSNKSVFIRQAITLPLCGKSTAAIHYCIGQVLHLSKGEMFLLNSWDLIELDGLIFLTNKNIKSSISFAVPSTFKFLKIFDKKLASNLLLRLYG